MRCEEDLNWSDFEWELLVSLRKHFLEENFASHKTYWTSRRLLELYHKSFAERIGWKWGAVLDLICSNRNIDSTQKYILFDFGCGTGIAAQKTVEKFGTQLISEVWLWDNSKTAISFAAENLKLLNSDLKIKEVPRLAAPKSPWILCLSHVINEITESDLEQIIPLAEAADFVIWLEPGTPEHSLRLIRIRERLLGRVNVIAPCNHNQSCGILDPKNKNNWCHFFAQPPAEVFQSKFWKKFSDKMKIDSRSLPISFLVLSRKKKAGSPTVRTSRIIGRPRIYKGFAKLLLCNETGVQEKRIFEKNDKLRFKKLKSPVFVDDNEESGVN